MPLASTIEYRVPELFEPMPTPRRRLLGLHRPLLEELKAAGCIRVITVTRPSDKRPLDLVYIPSLLAHLERLEELADNQRRAKIRDGYAHHHKPEDLLQVVPE
jgi:hypothetical protein